jgi:uncharacterized protein YndB with AHSA1/START domain
MSKLVYKIELRASARDVWHAWTDTNTITKWFSPHANIVPKLNGPEQKDIDPENHEHQCTTGCIITEFKPYKS